MLLHTKKAQYYVISAIVLCSLAVVLVTNNMIGGKDRDSVYRTS
jgi:hypothetical protein